MIWGLGQYGNPYPTLTNRGPRLNFRFIFQPHAHIWNLTFPFPLVVTKKDSYSKKKGSRPGRHYPDLDLGNIYIKEDPFTISAPPDDFVGENFQNQTFNREDRNVTPTVRLKSYCRQRDVGQEFISGYHCKMTGY